MARRGAERAAETAVQGRGGHMQAFGDLLQGRYIPAEVGSDQAQHPLADRGAGRVEFEDLRREILQHAIDGGLALYDGKCQVALVKYEAVLGGVEFSGDAEHFGQPRTVRRRRLCQGDWMARPASVAASAECTAGS